MNIQLAQQSLGSMAMCVAMNDFINFERFAENYVQAMTGKVVVLHHHRDKLPDGHHDWLAYFKADADACLAAIEEIGDNA